MFSGSMCVLCRGLKNQHKNWDNASTWSSCRPRGNCVISIKKSSSQYAWRGTCTCPASILAD